MPTQKNGRNQTWFAGKPLILFDHIPMNKCSCLPRISLSQPSVIGYTFSPLIFHQDSIHFTVQGGALPSYR